MPRWRPGESGNLRGRPKGSRNHATRVAQQLLDGQAEALALKVIQLALDGDVTCLKVALERLIAPRRDSPIDVRLPKVKDAGELPKLIGKVLHLVADGEITPGEGRELCAIAEIQRKTLELADIQLRLEKLEAQIR